MTGDNSARWPWWGAVADWRNWRLPVKLAAVLTVPVIVAVGAGMVQIQGDVRASDGYSAMQRMVTLRAGLDPLIAGVQAERALSARRGENSGLQAREYAELARVTDAAAAGVRNLLERTTSLGEVASDRFRDVSVHLDGLSQLRDLVLAGTADLAGAVGGYTVVLRALMDFDQAMVGDFGDPALSGTATALHNLAMAGEQWSWQHATVLAGISRGSLLDNEVILLEQSVTRQQDKIADFSAVATRQQQADYVTAVAGQAVDTRNSLLQLVRIDPGSVRDGVNPDVWHEGSVGAGKQLDTVLRRLENQLTETSTRLQEETSDRAGAASVILLASLFAAAAVGFVVGRNLLRSLRALRVAALDVAQHRLPTLVAQLREDAAPDVRIEPVPVHTTDELGQLARAFDAVHRQAVSSAAEQAELRAGMRNAFINLSRRSQGLVERQLRLMEELERQEQSPEQLGNLFKLDNLATRMRRNNENLMVLSGSDMARRFTRPVPLADVLRAAASEIEQYQRVVVQATPSVEVVGYAAGDLVRLVAELMDNATSFSPPRTQVVVGGRARPGGGVLVDVLDVGVGMSEEDLAQANRKIARAAADDSAELSVSRQLGLYVVGRLAGRHGIQVGLREQGEGVRAVVAVPAELVRAVTPPAAGPAAGPNTAGPNTAASTSAASTTAGPHTAGPTTAVPTTAAAREDGWRSFRGHARDSAPAAPTSARPAPRLRSTWFVGRSTAPQPNGSAQPPRHRAEDPADSAPGRQGVQGVQGLGVEGDDAELPKRRPRSNLVAERPGAPDAVAPVRRDPNATRGFLSSYQTGVRQGVRDSGENRTGRESTT
ncbi:nitrate- and nitrite sensing domain-containing protein [Actinosynnema sp. CS-041913]|uniref:nitrate- and nitrite sensing domain-containing protein n=1 Tax=Actinosynnema sp. CS-041913 TaxID=3239917 RepID=UPI003D93D02A